MLVGLGLALIGGTAVHKRLASRHDAPRRARSGMFRDMPVEPPRAVDAEAHRTMRLWRIRTRVVERPGMRPGAGRADPLTNGMWCGTMTGTWSPIQGAVMSTDATPPPAEARSPAGAEPWWAPGDNPLTTADVKTYATLAHAGTVLFALVFFPLMWAPPLALFLVFRTRDQAGLLRRHLAQALSFSAVLAIYALTIRYGLAAAEIDHMVTDLLPVALALVAAYPAVRAVQAARRLRPFTYPKAVAWIPVD